MYSLILYFWTKEPTSHVQSLADMSDILSLSSSDLCIFKKLTVFVLKTYRPGIKKTGYSKTRVPNDDKENFVCIIEVPKLL